MKKTVAASPSGDDKDSLKGLIFCALVALQFGLQPLLVKKFQGEVHCMHLAIAIVIALATIIHLP